MLEFIRVNEKLWAEVAAKVQEHATAPLSRRSRAGNGGPGGRMDRDPCADPIVRAVTESVSIWGVSEKRGPEYTVDDIIPVYPL